MIFGAIVVIGGLAAIIGVGAYTEDDFFGF